MNRIKTASSSIPIEHLSLLKQHSLPLAIPAVPNQFRHSPSTTQNHSGLSLLELVVVIAIVAVVSAIALPRYAGAVTRYRGELAARRIVTDLNFARIKARQTSSAIAVVFDTTREHYSIETAPPTLVVLTDKPYKVKLCTANFGGSNTVQFDGFGTPNSGGIVVLTAAPGRKTIVVLNGDTGKASVQ